MRAETGERRVVAGKGMPPPPEQEQLPCPRCDSTNTKFCYYNNYNFSQPRHFCKSCRRYWTHGGTLRDIPVGGATRKNAKRSRILPPTPSSYSSSTANTAFVSTDVFLKPPTFTSLLTSSSSMAVPGGFLALGGLGLGIGAGFEDAAAFGPLGRALWAFPEGGYISSGGVGVGGIGGGSSNATGNGDGGGMMNMWQLDSGGDQSAAFAGGDCLSWPDLAISTPGNGLK